MIVLSWNVRGLGSPKKIAEIKNYLKDINPSIIIIQESKAKEIDRAFIKSIWSSRYVGWVHKDAIGASGGIIIMWNELAISADEAIEGKNSLSLKISLSDGFPMWITGVYAPNSVTGRKNLWFELSELAHLCSPHWIIGVISTPLAGLGKDTTHWSRIEA